MNCMNVFFVTTNKGKVKSAKAALKKYGIVVKQIEIELVESRSEDPRQIALEKAKQAYDQLGKPVIVEDSGFFINALGGFPMTHIKFSLHTLGIKNILKMLRGLKNRRAEWRMSVAYVSGRGQYKTFTFIEKGEIAKTQRPIKRKMMSDYWRIYIPKMISTNKLALCEMRDKDLEEWRQYHKNHNQFEVFGRWYSKK
jgi:XTP/dITP diphosphohydrolase